LVLAVGLLAPRGAGADTPDTPEVKQIVERGLKFLESQDDERLGAKCLIGLSFYKAGRPLTHPKIAAARQACESAIGSAASIEPSHVNYSLGLGLVFLLETDPQKNRSLAVRYVTEILRRQQKWGSWSYPESQTGDTSQTQYPTLGLWLAVNNGLTVPISAIDKDCAWLLRTQDPSGAWGYQGRDPGHYQRVTQDQVTPALAAAGLGSLYVTADVLGLLQEKQQAKKETSLPSALKPVGDPLAIPKTVATSVDASLVRKGIYDGNRWFGSHYTLQSDPHTYYYLYAFERYQSFKEFAEKRVDPNPKWYNDIVGSLKKTQDEDGSWNGNDGAPVSTSFAVLTLLRSAKKTLATVQAKLGDGILLGGMGLPKNTADLQERDGKILETPLAGTIDELMTTLEKGNSAELERLAESSARWKLDSDVTKRSGEIIRLRAIVSAGSYESRLVAVRALARVREFDNVPILIYALSDPDMRIVREADKGLRFISRKFDGVGLSDEPKPPEAKAAIAAWKAWYQSVRPSAEFLD
jgi:hypothetical protein